MDGNPTHYFESNGDFHCDTFYPDDTGATSDRDLKKNIIPLTDSLAKVLKLKGVNFEWKKDGKDGLNAGLIAQEVEFIIPEVVLKKYLPLKKGEYRVIKYNQLIPYLIESIKELKKEIDELKENKNEDF